ncbi:hypothetical protein [Metaclostridioides mangenotii]|uniref:hypothetical protein n=1 Tax=Metaclostridioides mangenotii TaxID=1540 RepID=UPI000AF90AE8|nr:hypothetical protein [Clostridioides mangenotii]
MSKKKVWVDAGLIGMTIDLLNEELRTINKDMRKIPKSPKVTNYLEKKEGFPQIK